MPKWRDKTVKVEPFLLSCLIAPQYNKVYQEAQPFWTIYSKWKNRWEWESNHLLATIHRLWRESLGVSLHQQILSSISFTVGFQDYNVWFTNWVQTQKGNRTLQKNLQKKESHLWGEIFILKVRYFVFMFNKYFI